MPRPSLGELVLNGDEGAVLEGLRALHRACPDSALTAITCKESFDRNGKSLLHRAAQSGRANILRHCLGFDGVDPNAVDDACNTALHCAAEQGHARVAYLLLHSGVDAEASNAFGRTAAQLAEEQTWDRESTKTGKKLIRRMLAGDFPDYGSLPAEPESVEVQESKPLLLGNEGMRSMHIKGRNSGATSGFQEAAAIPLETRASPPKRPGFLKAATAGLPAASNSEEAPRNTKAMASRRASAPSILAGDEDEGLLAELVKTGNVSLVQAKITELDEQHGPGTAKAEVVNCEAGVTDSRIGLSALHVAARRGYTDIVRVLLSTGASPNVANDQWNTPLHLAAESGKAGAAEVLLRAGADAMIRNSFGRSAKDLASSKEFDTKDVADGKSLIMDMLKMAL